MSKRLVPLLTAVLLVASPSVSWAQAQTPPDNSRPPLPTEPKPAGPSIVIVASDADASVTLKSGAVERTVTVKTGDTRIELPQGHFVVTVDPAVARADPAEGELTEAGQEVRVVVTTQGRVSVTVPGNDGRVELDGKPLAAKEGKASAELAAGTHSVIVRQPGYFGVQGAVVVPPGRTAEVSAQLEKFTGGGNQTLAWTAIVGGGALVVAAVAIDAFSKYDQIGGDATRWTLLGLGSVGFVGGTILLKSAIDAEASPPVRDGRFDVKIAGVRGGAVAMVGGRF